MDDGGVGVLVGDGAAVVVVGGGGGCWCSLVRVCVWGRGDEGEHFGLLLVSEGAVGFFEHYYCFVEFVGLDEGVAWVAG